MAVSSRPEASCRCDHPETCVDRHQGRYLVAIYRLTPGRDGRVRTGDVGDRLDVTSASVTGMFERLATDDLVDHEKHAGVELTRHGTEIARTLAWRQCVVRSFFDEELDVALSAEDGYRIGFTLPDEGVERLRMATGG